MTIPSAASVGNGRSITLLRPRDERPNPAVIGAGARGVVCFASCTAHAYTQTDVAVWIGNAIAAGLEHANFRIDRAENLDQSPTPVALEIVIREAYVHYDETRVAVVVEAYRTGQTQRLFRRSYAGVSTMGSGSSGDAYQQALQDALRKLLDQAIPNLAGALARVSG
jgi:hypothetical protein